ncbi:Protein of unknown function DUF3464 [Macleaya cordata]|uniref:Uncharacterized protein n=1 Tax=Macleaya cordata TaxID=56857 RepID=A0A200PV81_MACCD|nr:Protein of unknown function DUF3464 [Macleaya cordata]
MKTLQLSLGLPSPLQITKTPTWTHRNSDLKPIVLAAAIPYNPSSCSKRALKLQAKAKGFGSGGPAPVVALSEKNARRDENVPRNGGKNDDGDDKIAPVVWERMIVRILFSVGAPMASGVALLYVFGTLKDNHIWDVPLWLPFLTTLIAFGTSAIGIAYGTLSTSLDPEKKGSVLGWEEVQKNWPELWKEDIE